MPKKQNLSQSMSSIDRLIHSTLDPREIVQRVIAEAAQAVGNGTAVVFLRQGDQWIVRCVHHLPEDVIGAQLDGQQEPHILLAIKTRTPVVINDAFTDERVNREYMKERGIRSVLVVPVSTEDRVVGVLLFHRDKSGVPFTEAHVQFADQLAASLAPVLRNTRRFERLQAELAEHKRAKQVSQKAKELLQVQMEESQTQAEELRIANEELHAQQEELQAQTEELRASEQSLRESEQRYRSLFENMLDGYAHCRMLFDGAGHPTDFVYLSVNDAFTKLTGLRDVIGKKITEVIPTIRAAHSEVLEIYGRVAATGQPERFEVELKPLGIWLSIAVYSPQKGYFTAVFDNITQRKRAEEALRQLGERNEEALRVAHMGHWEFDLATGIFTFNDQYYTLHGTTAQEAGGYQISAHEFARKYVHPDDAHLVQEHIQQAAAATDPNFQLQAEARILRADGVVRWVTVWFRVEKDAHGKTTKLHGVNQDITERKYAEEVLQKVNEQLQAQTRQLQTQAEELQASEEVLRDLNATLESKVAQRTAQLQQRARQLQKLTLEASQMEDRERKRMAEILHDDLQQIIAGAKFHLSLLRSRFKYDASLQALATQIDGMLQEAIGKARGLSHELSPAILHRDSLTEIFDWLANQMQAKHGLVVHVHANSQACLQSDATKVFLYKTAQELLFNVVKHARVKEARIRVRRCGPYVYMSVSDRGCGFDPQGLRETAGFGLLSIRERIELLGGRMKIKSAKGKGSTFLIIVPEGEHVATPPLSEVVAALPEVTGPQAHNRLRVLLADDHRIVRDSLRLLLSDESDLEIVGEAAHGREAVDLALRLKPDVVIMDVSMPLIDGDLATRQIKEHLPQMRVIALSTYNEPETIKRMYRAGAENYVLKTASSEELLAAIRGREPSGKLAH